MKTMIAAAERLYLLLTLLIPGGQAGAVPVAALLRHSAEFYYSDLALPVLVMWNFLTQNKTIRVAMYHKDQFTIFNTQFTDRLDLSDNGTKLRVKDLRMEDTGVYTAQVTFTNGEIHHATYVLTVYEPIPPPNVITVQENPTDGCNVTLQCSVPSNTSDLSYTWKYRHQDSEYQDYNTGSTIQISLPPDHQDTEILCIVQNPADQKNVSVTVEFCSGTDWRHHWYIFLIIPLFIMITVGFIIWKKRRKHLKNVEEEKHCVLEARSTETPSSVSQNLPYDLIPHRTNPPPQKFETLYTSLGSKT